MARVAACLALVASLAGAAWGQTAGTAWLAEGKVFLVRGAALYAVADGVKVYEADILRTEDKSQVQLQLADGNLVNAGGGTRLMLVSVPAKSAAGAEVALAGGWLKIAQPAGARLRLWTPSALLTLEGAAAVVRLSAESLQVFLESGTLAVTEPADKARASATHKPKAGEFLTLAGRKAATAPRPGRDFIEAMPRHFRDPLPALPDKVRDRKVEPRRERDVAYDDVSEWLRSAHPARKGFVRRFMPRTADAAFRAALDANMRSHMEWDRVLHPEKYEPKPDPDKPAPTKGAKP